MQTQTAVPAPVEQNERTVGLKIFFGVFGALLVITYLFTLWMFVNGLWVLVGGGRAVATVTNAQAASSTDDGGPVVTSTVSANNAATSFGIQTSEAASQYTFHFKAANGQEVDKDYVTTAYDLNAGSQVNVIYNPGNPSDFIMDGFTPMFYYFCKNCLLFLTLTAIIIFLLVRQRIKKKRPTRLAARA